MEISSDFMVDLTVWFQGSTPHTWQTLEVRIKEIWFRLSKGFNIPRISHHFWLLVLRHLMFINFRTVSCGPKKEIRIMWCLNPLVFRKGQTWSNPRIFSWISAKMGFHWETWPCYKISCKWHLGNMREEETSSQPFWAGSHVSVSRWANLVKQCSYTLRIPPILDKHLIL